MAHSPQSGDAGLPSFTLDSFTLQLPSTPSSRHISSPVPRVRITPKRNDRIVRPSTASAIEEKATLLPSAPTGTVFEVTSPDARAGAEYVIHRGVNLGAQDDATTQIASAKMPSGPRSQSTLGSMQSPFEAIGAPEEVLPDGTSEGTSETVEYDYDWATFMTAYAAGRWDPHRTPNPPRSNMIAPSESTFSHSWPSVVADDDKRSSLPPPQKMSDTSPPHLTSIMVAPSDMQISPVQEQPSLPIAILPSKMKRPGLPLKLPPSSMHHLRNSFSELRLPMSSTDSTSPSLYSDMAATHSNADVATAAATMRWAAARVNLSPLSLPSPEHELTDPMRGVTASIPGSHHEIYVPNEPPTPGETRKIRLASFWEGTQDVEDNPLGNLSTIEGSPSESRKGSPRTEHPLGPSMPFPASAPLVRNTSKPFQDYFATPTTSLDGIQLPTQESSVLSRRPDSPSDFGPVSVPVANRRTFLTRQISSPLPESTRLQRYAPGRVVSQHSTPPHIKMGRAAREEQLYSELGYLIPPNPPDEWKRRRALSKFNIWSTGPDLNFDRIAHLAKLVFNTKGVIISLVDGNDENFLKSKWGMNLESCSREHTFCAHAILQRDDEPLVILDAQADWRFANHPYVISAPHIRFYAGAPLRTQDGYNVGTLAVLDDLPREDFSPRERHTLKEFAAIAMREMELWRDKIQLRIRDRIQTSMEQFSRECLEIETKAGDQEHHEDFIVGASMERVYDRAAKLVKRTLDVEGVIVMDISHCEVIETMGAEGTVSVVIHHGDPRTDMKSRTLSQEEYSKLVTFFSAYPDGKISEGIVPTCLRPFLPTHIQYALTVPIFNIDKRPFALLCAYNSADHPTRFLEGHELSYLRAIGVIILSAVLKRRMILADKAKSLFISNISHELRTPLHGILAAAELLTDTQLDSNQISFLQTVQACGTSLVETVNHVLDFTKLSGNSKSGGVDNIIIPSRVDLMQLVEEAADGGWIGHRARMFAQNSEIGSVYSPPLDQQSKQDTTLPASADHVETVIEIGYRETGWLFKCERGGIRRVLMNLLGNSLKFTTNGFVHVGLRQLPPVDDIGENYVRIELSVLDTGKGISQAFLKNQMFHPFSQENPLQTGTGLGLAIVNSIVQSESVGGKIEVWSEEGVGTEIKVIFTAEAVEPDTHTRMEPLVLEEFSKPPTVSLLAFDKSHKGVETLHRVLSSYLVTWWGLIIQQDGGPGDIIIINEDPALVELATYHRDISRPFIILCASRGDPKVMAAASDHERIGGFCRVLYKPGGPSRLRSALKICLNILRIRRRQTNRDNNPELHCTSTDDITLDSSPPGEWDGWDVKPLKPRRHSEEHIRSGESSLDVETIIDHSQGKPPFYRLPSMKETEETTKMPPLYPEVNGVALGSPTIPIGPGGSLLKSSVGTINSKDLHYRVLVVEDNCILRNLLIKWLKAKGHDFRDAVDGRDGVNVYATEGPFDVVLLDLSMPVLDGIGATTEIRKIEAERGTALAEHDHVRILALTGMSSLEDKRRAFDAGVDGYLVKPVAFKTLEEMFRQLSADDPA